MIVYRLQRFVGEPDECVFCDDGIATRRRYPFDFYYHDHPNETGHPCELCHGTGVFTPIGFGPVDPCASFWIDLGGES